MTRAKIYYPLPVFLSPVREYPLPTAQIMLLIFFEEPLKDEKDLPNHLWQHFAEGGKDEGVKEIT